MPEKKLLVEKLTKKILEEIPRELLELFYSEELPLKTSNICLDCGLEEEKDLEKVGTLVGKVLYGGLSPEKLLDALKKEEGFPPIRAAKIFREIDGQIFSSVRASLNKLYKKEEIIEKPRARKEVTPLPSEKPPPPKKTDVYREPIE